MAVPPPSPGAGEKALLRAALRTQRSAFVAALSAEQRAAHLDALAERLMPQLAGYACISAYVAMGSEINPAPLLDRLGGRGVTLAMPYVTDKRLPMRFLRWKPGDALAEGTFGLLQPDEHAEDVEPDCILAPLLGFDRTGSRIGQGAGFYDRAFAVLPAVRRIGLAWSVQEVESVPMDPWDVPLHAIATELDWIA